MHHRIPYRKSIAGLILSLGVLASSANAGIPVTDGTNLPQNIISAIQSVRQTVQQIEEYRTQLNQYRMQLQEVESWTEVDYSWESVQDVLDNLADITRKIDYFDDQVRDFDGYLKKFQDIAYYEKSPCYTGQGCSAEEREEMEQNRLVVSENQKEANDAKFLQVQKHKDQLDNDIVKLELQRQRASTATDQKAILAYANQFAMEQTKHLIKIEELLLSQHEVATHELMTKSDEESRRAAANKNFRRGTFIKSPKVVW